MAQQTINVGTSPDDGTGTLLRDAFIMTNANFTELYNYLTGTTGYYNAGDTNPSGVATPAAGFYYFGVYNDELWIKNDAGEIKYFQDKSATTTEIAASSASYSEDLSFAESVIEIHKDRITADSGIYLPNKSSYYISRLKSQNILYKTKLALVPNSQKAASLYSVVPSSGDGDFTVARTDMTIRTNYMGYLEEVQANVPLIDGDGILETHPASENLITYPKSLGNSYWTKSGSEIQGDPSSAGSELFVSPTLESGWTGTDPYTCDGTASAKVYKNGIATAGETYLITWDIDAGSTGTVRIRNQGTLDGTNYSAVGSYEVYYYAVETGYLGFVNYSSFVGSISNVSIKQVTGYDSPLLETVYGTGSEQITASDNRDFTAGIGNWLNSGGATASHSTDKLSCLLAGSGQSGTYLNAAYFGDGIIIDQMYRVNVDIWQGTTSATNIIVQFGNSFKVITIDGTQTTYTLYITPQASNYLLIAATASDGGTLFIDNVSVKPVTSITTGSPTKDAYKLVEDGTTGAHSVAKFNALEPTTITSSVFAKAGERKYIALGVGGATDYALFNLETGVYDSDAGIISDYSIEPLVNGWYRISTTGLNDNDYWIGIANDSKDISYTGDGTSGVYLAFPQLEEQSYASPLMLPVTEGSTTTRVADAITGAGSQALFSSVNTSGVLYAEIAANSDNSTYRAISISDNTDQNKVLIYFNASSNRIRGIVTLANVTQCDMTYDVDITDFHKVAVKYSENDFALWVDGVERATDNSGSTFSASTLTTLDFDNGGASQQFYGKTKAIYVTEVLTDDELTSLTTP